MREYRGVVKNGVVILEDGSDLPDGTKVRVIVEEAQMWQPSEEKWEHFWQFLQTAWKVELREGEQVHDDVSERIDEYLAEALLKHKLARKEEGDEK